MKRRQANIQLLIIIAILVVFNLLGAAFFVRWDLTSEKRYSLSDLTKETVDELDYPVFATIFLEGEFPPNIREFQDAIRTTLIEMKQYGGSNIDFEFVDPGNNRELMQSFTERSYAPIPVKVRVSATEEKTQFMWPLIRFIYRDREVFVDLLKGASVMTPQGPNVDFTKAEADLEYKLVSAIRKLQKERGGVIALLQGHGELPPEEVPELTAEISNNYNFYTLNLANVPGYAISPTIDVLLILRPTRRFSERDKYEIDQYLMRGGSILWGLDFQRVDMDMYQKQSTITDLYDLRLNDMFMKYGFKVNTDLVQDLESESTEVFQPGPGGGAFLSKKWIFYPMVLDFPDHPINRNVDAVLLRYAGTIDTFARPGVAQQVFLTSSPRSRTVQNKQFIDVNQIIQSPPPAALFNKGNRITGLLTEGIFQSLFVGRDAPVDSLAPVPPTATFGPQNNPIAPGAIVVISDGEFFQGKQFRAERQYMPYDNKTLAMNAIDYLAGDEALTQIRSKEVVVRRISREKARERAGTLRIINIALPIILLLIFGLVRSYLRKRRNQQLENA